MIRDDEELRLPCREGLQEGIDWILRDGRGPLSLVDVKVAVLCIERCYECPIMKKCRADFDEYQKTRSHNDNSSFVAGGKFYNARGIYRLRSSKRVAIETAAYCIMRGWTDAEIIDRLAITEKLINSARKQMLWAA